MIQIYFGENPEDLFLFNLKRVICNKSLNWTVTSSLLYSVLLFKEALITCLANLVTFNLLKYAPSQIVKIYHLFIAVPSLIVH